jgi:hypothetical protein
LRVESRARSRTEFLEHVRECEGARDLLRKLEEDFHSGLTEELEERHLLITE